MGEEGLGGWMEVTSMLRGANGSKYALLCSYRSFARLLLLILLTLFPECCEWLKYAEASMDNVDGDRDP
jgi:hypothetical protein